MKKRQNSLSFLDKIINKIINKRINKKNMSFLLILVLFLTIFIPAVSSIQAFNGEKESKEEDFSEVKEVSENSTMDLQTREETITDRMDFTDKITEITVLKRSDGVWIPSKEFEDNDEIRVEIDYGFGPDELTAENAHIYYQLPGGIKVSKEQTGRVIDDGKEVGSYKITKDGRIEIDFDDAFVAAGTAIEANLTFTARLSKEDAGDSGEINFPGSNNTITIVKPDVPEIDDSDINIEKTSEINKNKTKVNYELTVSSEKGSQGPVTIFDNLNQWNSSNIEYAYNKESLKVAKIEANGTSKPIATINVGWKEKTNSQNTGFTISDLPPLGPGEEYKIKYDVDITPEADSDHYQLDNYADARSGEKEDRADNSIKWSKDLKKKGNYNPQTGLINWTITINPDGKDVSGWTFIDNIPGEVVGDAILRRESPWKEEKLKLNNNQIYHQFPNDLDEQAKTSKYTIYYSTKPAKGESQVTNTGELWGDEVSGNGYVKDEEVVEIVEVEREADLNKGKEDSKKVEDNLYKNDWYTTITLPEGNLDAFTYEDIIKDAVDTEGKSVGSDSHYAFASELEGNLKESFAIIIDDEQTNYRYQGDGKPPLHNTKGETDEIAIKVKYYDKNDKIVKADDKETKVKRFTIQVTPKESFNFKANSMSIANYSTYTDLRNLEGNVKVKSVNKAIYEDLEKEASVDHEKIPRLVKEVKTGKKNDADVYKPGSSSINYDQYNGKIKYRLMLKTTEADNGDIVLKDTLPKEVQFDENSLKGRFFGNEYDKPKTNYDGFEFQDGENPEYEIKEKDGQQELKIKIKNYKFAKGYPRVVIYYEVDVQDDDYWDDFKNDKKEYKNNVEWGTESSETQTEVERDLKKVDKIGQQLDTDGNPLLDKDGNIVKDARPSNNIRYRAVINPKAENLDRSSNTLTLTDTLEGGDNVNPVLDIQSVKLYKYDPAATDGKGDSVNEQNYTLTYDQRKRQLIMKVPDETALVVEYLYSVDPSFATGLSLTNKINLSGNWSSNDQASLKEMSSSATATTKSIKVYKVDEDNFKKTLAGTEFKLEYFDEKDDKEYFDEKDDKWKVKTKKLVIPDEGFIHWRDLVGNNKDLETNILYRLVETKALDGYQKAEEPTYFIWKNATSTDKSAKEQAGVEKSRVPTEDIHFLGNSGGTIYISNKYKYTRLSVHKIWQDDKGDIILPPENQSVKVNLFREQLQADGYEVKVISKVNQEWPPDDKVETVLVNKETKDGITIKVDGWLGNPKYKYEDAKGIVKTGKLDTSDYGNTWTLIIPSITANTKITITNEDSQPNKINFTDYQNPEMIVKKSEQIGKTIELNKLKDWVYHWDGLKKKDSKGNPYQYKVEEIGLEGYTTSYTNNEGVVSGDVNIINTKDPSIDYELPETGGPGTRIIYGLGLTLFVGGVIYLAIDRTQSKDKE